MKYINNLVVVLALFASSTTFFFGTVASAQVRAIGPPADQRVVPAKLYKSNDIIVLARNDAKLIQLAAVRTWCRYLSLHNYAPEDRDNIIRLVDFACNSLSRERTMAYATVVDPDKALLRVQINDYGWTKSSWDELGEIGSGPLVSTKKIAQPDPYFHEVTSIDTTPVIRKTRQVYKINANGQRVLVNEVYDEKVTVSTHIQLAHASWLNPADISELALLLETDYPVFRADWFIANALLPPSYYKFLGVKTLEDFNHLVRFRDRDEDLAIKGVVVDSEEVALHQRALRYIPTVQGAYWESYDYFTSVGDDDLLKNLLAKHRDAGEIIANLPNSLPAYALVDGKNKIIDFADPNVAINQNTAWKNKLVWTGYSCMSCHVDGMKDIRDEVRVLSRPPFALLAKNHHDFRKVIDLFSAPIEEPIDTTKRIYNRGIALATRGLTPRQNAANLDRYFLAFNQKNLDLFDAAMEVGCHPDKVRAILERTTTPDHTLTQLLAGRPVRRDQWEAAGFKQLAILTVNVQ